MASGVSRGFGIVQRALADEYARLYENFQRRFTVLSSLPNALKGLSGMGYKRSLPVRDKLLGIQSQKGDFLLRLKDGKRISVPVSLLPADYFKTRLGDSLSWDSMPLSVVEKFIQYRQGREISVLNPEEGYRLFQLADEFKDVGLSIELNPYAREEDLKNAKLDNFTKPETFSKLLRGTAELDAMVQIFDREVGHLQRAFQPFEKPSS